MSLHSVLQYIVYRLANKQDKSGALDEVDICDQLNLEELVNKFKTPCRVVSYTAFCHMGIILSTKHLPLEY